MKYLSLLGEWLSGSRLRNRLLVIFMLVFAIPVTLLGGYYTVRIVRLSEEMIYIKNESNANQLKLNLQNEMERLAQSVIRATSDNDLIVFFTRNYDYAGEYFADYSVVRQKLSFLSATTFNGMHMYVSTMNSSIIPNYYSIYSLTDHPPDWYDDAIQNSGMLRFMLMDNNLVIHRTIINSEYDLEKSAVFTVVVPGKRFSEYYQNEADGIGVYLLGPNGIVYSSNHEDMISKPFPESFGQDEALVFKKTIFDEQPYGEWTLVYDASAHALELNLSRLFGGGLFLLAACFIIVVVSVIYISKLLARRIHRLDTAVYEKELTVKDLEIESKEARIQAMQGQIEPHFLFNTLQTIQMLLAKNQAKQTTQVVESLAVLMQNRIYWNNETVTLKKEVDMVKHYLIIQGFRFQKRLSYAFDVPERFYETGILQFSIQPLVENAIRHGIDQLENGGFIRISVTQNAAALEVSVCDNGVGIDNIRLEQISAALASDMHSCKENIGLRNVHQRLRLYFGEEFGIVSIESKIGKGTRIVLRIPYHE